MMIYQVAIIDGKGLTYDPTEVDAVDDEEAKDKAKKWVHSQDGCLQDDAWLQVVKNGRGIASYKLGSF